MSVLIKSGGSSNYLTIDATSKAARITEYSADGSELNPPPAGVYMLPIDVRVTGTTGTFFWSMKVATGATKSVYIRKIYIRTGWDGTSAAAANLLTIVRGNTFTFSGGTALTPIALDASFPTSIIDNARQSTGTTLSGSAASALPLFSIQIDNQTATNTRLFVDLQEPSYPFGLLRLGATEGIYIFLSGTNHVGELFSGYVLWEER